eukprot:CAMPEP_0178745866 /NCGR_PEP_ID=MMETSP0744-20121128/7515_1 /TAXON_ID=913974 /ORGANISM="Nitzschia punctata, Strain CCMP561" /LENGTH=473 /DNA_ID=CAMNT_0020399061 /DNA_START=160 /DNA_END=1584 /DNA_ORIENTATION=-
MLGRTSNLAVRAAKSMAVAASKGGHTTALSFSSSQAANLAQELIRIPSVTPQDRGCQDVVRQRLETMGFVCETLSFQDVTNLWAVYNPVANHNHNTNHDHKPLVAFIGHTDVVPSGPVEAWSYPPFDGKIVAPPSDGEDDYSDAILYGRGAVDMKGGIAAFLVALETFLGSNSDNGDDQDENGPSLSSSSSSSSSLPYSIGVLLTSDEEGDAQWGTRATLEELKRRNVQIDMAIVGEPSSLSRVGDVVKVGRRGSLSGDLSIIGIQGHVAYPHLAKNPIHESLGALKDMVDEVWDEGTEDFPPTSFQISNIQSGTGALNIIPGFKKVHFNFRYSPATTDIQLKNRVHEILNAHELDYTLSWSETNFPYETSWPSELVEEAMASVKDVMDYTAKPCTSGGTSDGRFVAMFYPKAQIVEMGLINETIHKVDEHTSVRDLESLVRIYVRLLERLQAAESMKQKVKYHDHVPIEVLP